jgi:flagellar secretion chaperone FliS
MTVPSNPALRQRYLADSIATASPAKLLMMLYDRLALDLNRGEEALRANDRITASQHLIHAQDIVLELRTSLNMDVWDGADRLAQIYTFLLTELVGANINADADRVASSRSLVEPLREAWREAAIATMAPVATVTR